MASQRLPVPTTTNYHVYHHCYHVYHHYYHICPHSHNTMGKIRGKSDTSKSVTERPLVSLPLTITITAVLFLPLGIDIPDDTTAVIVVNASNAIAST